MESCHATTVGLQSRRYVKLVAAAALPEQAEGEVRGWSSGGGDALAGPTRLQQVVLAQHSLNAER